LSVRSSEVLAAVAAAPGALEGTSLLSEVSEAAGRASTRGRSGAGRADGRGRAARPEAIVSLPGETPSAGQGVGLAGGGARLGDVRSDSADDLSVDSETIPDASGLVSIQMEGDGPLVVREKFHASRPMSIDQALLEMELVGHDFYAFHDRECGKFSVVYRRRGYDYGVIRLVEED
jgi:hypothetical protein